MDMAISEYQHRLLWACNQRRKYNQPLIIFSADPVAAAGNQIEICCCGGAENALDDRVIWAASRIINRFDRSYLERVFLTTLLSDDDLITWLDSVQVPKDSPAAIVAIHMAGKYSVPWLARLNAKLPPERLTPDRVTGWVACSRRFHRSIAVFSNGLDGCVNAQVGNLNPDRLAGAGVHKGMGTLMCWLAWATGGAGQQDERQIEYGCSRRETTSAHCSHNNRLPKRKPVHVVRHMLFKRYAYVPLNRKDHQEMPIMSIS
jgi:hypothetical protein